MTAQIEDKLKFKGETYFLATEPLKGYLDREGIEFFSFSTACWRGYIATWQIKDDKLFLVDLEANTIDGEEVGLRYLFPKQYEVFAEWFSGELRVPYGELLEYIHAGYCSIYEKELHLYFKDGSLYRTQEQNNRDEHGQHKKR